MNNNQSTYHSSSIKPGLFLLLLLVLPFNPAWGAQQNIKGVVVDHLSRDRLNDVIVELFLDDILLDQQPVNAQRPFNFRFNHNNDGAYKLVAKKEGYQPEVVKLSRALQAGHIPTQIRLSMRDQDSHFLFKGKVLNRDNGKPVANSHVIVKNRMTGEIQVKETDYDGAYTIKVDSGYEYDVEIHDSAYLKRYAHINYCGDTLADNHKYCFKGFSNLSLSPDGGVTAATTLLDKVEIGKTFRVDNIYYDYNKASLRSDALVNLDRVYHILEDNKQLIVELGSHADSRGSDAYNLNLSQKRAESAVSYITKKGITTTRITAKGYGEGQPINHCTNGVKCSKAEYAQNRRTEFTIIDIDESKIEKYPYLVVNE